MSDKRRRIILGPHVMLPPISTSVGERPMSAFEFLESWVLASPGLKGNDTLQHLFELENALEPVKKAAIEKSGADLPRKLEVPADMSADAARELVAKYQATYDSYWRCVYDATVGMSLDISDAAFQAAVTSVKAMLDDVAKQRNPQGGPALDPFVERRILRLYHAFAQSREVDSN